MFKLVVAFVALMALAAGPAAGQSVKTAPEGFSADLWCSVCKFVVNKVGVNIGETPTPAAFEKAFKGHCASNSMKDAVGPIKMACPKLLTQANIATMTTYLKGHMTQFKSSEELALGVCRDSPIAACKADGASSFDKLLNQPKPPPSVEVGNEGGKKAHVSPPEKKKKVKDPVTGRVKHVREDL